MTMLPFMLRNEMKTETPIKIKTNTSYMKLFAGTDCIRGARNNELRIDW